MKEQDQDLNQELQTVEQFTNRLSESVKEFVCETDVFTAIKALKTVKELYSRQQDRSPATREEILKAINSLENLLIEIARIIVQRQKTMLANYEQSQN